MGRRAGIRAFGSAALLVVAGVLCAALVKGLTGQVLAIAFFLAGFGGALLLVFYEVGLSEDRERAREEQRRRERSERRLSPQRRLRPRWPRRPG
jgi:hypothetical protein